MYLNMLSKILVLCVSANPNWINLIKIIDKAKIENPSKINITGPPLDNKFKLYRFKIEGIFQSKKIKK